MSKYLISLILLSVISMGVSAQRITRQYKCVILCGIEGFECSTG